MQSDIITKDCNTCVFDYSKSWRCDKCCHDIKGLFCGRHSRLSGWMIRPSLRDEKDDSFIYVDIKRMQNMQQKLNELRSKALAETTSIVRVAPISVPKNKKVASKIRLSFNKGLWHTDCENHLGGICKEVMNDKENKRSLWECLHCGKKGYYPYGAIGERCVDEVIDQEEKE